MQNSYAVFLVPDSVSCGVSYVLKVEGGRPVQLMRSAEIRVPAHVTHEMPVRKHPGIDYQSWSGKKKTALCRFSSATPHCFFPSSQYARLPVLVLLEAGDFDLSALSVSRLV